MLTSERQVDRAHPRTLGWVGTTALAMGGSNQSLFILGALFIGQGDISGQGSACVILLIVGLLLSLAAAPGWIELVLMWPNRVGGIASTCSEAFRPYNPVLANLTGVCYWWGWVPTCGVCALLSASAIHSLLLPAIPITVIACSLVTFFTVINLCGIKWMTRVTIPFAILSASLAFLSTVIPIFSGTVNWTQAFTFNLIVPFEGTFGQVTSAMAGIYLVGFAAPAFEAACCHVGETRDEEKNVPRAVFASALMSCLYFVAIPLIWLGALGPKSLGEDLAISLGPVFAPIFGGAAKSVAVWFMIVNMFHGTIQALAGPSRTMAQLAEDGLLPRAFSLRSKTDAPWFATCTTALLAMGCIFLGCPIWLIAAANFTYLIGISLPSIAVWLLRKDEPELHRPYRAPRGTIVLGLIAAFCWLLSTVFGFQQFGLPTVILGLCLAYSGAALYALRQFLDRRSQGLPGIAKSLHIKLTGAMLLVLLLDSIGYWFAVETLPRTNLMLITVLEDIFVAVAILTISVGLVLPGMISHSAVEVSKAARKLATVTLPDFCSALDALGRGNLNAVNIRTDVIPVRCTSADEVGEMAQSFNSMQAEIFRGVDGLHNAREKLAFSQNQLMMAMQTVEAANRSKSQFLATMSHEIRTPMNGILGMTQLTLDSQLSDAQHENLSMVKSSAEALLTIINDILDFSKVEAGKLELHTTNFSLRHLISKTLNIFAMQADEKNIVVITDIEDDVPDSLYGDPVRLGQILINLIGNAVKFTNISGGIVINIELGEMEDDNIELIFNIADSGIGISEQAQSELFQPFRQADASTTRNYGGTGLGLCIVKNLVELMGGNVTLKSKLGMGSRFSFSTKLKSFLKSAEESCSKSNSLSETTQRSLSVLIIEDNLINQKLVTKILERRGHKVISAENGALGLEKYHNFRDELDLVLMDCEMPVLDGFQTTARIRESEKNYNKKIPIIAMTANAMVGDREKCLAAGMSDYLSKPIDIKLLLEKLEQFGKN